MINLNTAYSHELSFGILNQSYIDWYSCRERFHADSRRETFAYWASDVGNVIAFIRRAEDILGLSELERAKISLTDHPKILFIKYGSFWRLRCRKQLFTILVRAGSLYNPKTRNFWVTIKKNDYLAQTKPAFCRFMKGYTFYDGARFTGWVKIFARQPKNTAKLKKYATS